MKKILFKTLKLHNFCGIRAGVFDFGEDLTVISGDNGRGKSTIGNAIMYTLFGTDTNGMQLDIKTFDENHNIIKEIEHSSELVMLVDGDEISFKRVLVDKWKGDKCTNTFKYIIDGELTTAGDFSNVVDNIFQEDPFAWCICPNLFLGMTWQNQRAFLQSLAGDISVEDVTKGEEKYDYLVELLKQKNIDAILHHLKHKRTEVQKELDAVPIRLSELDKALPEKQDWDALETEKAELKEKLVEIDNKVQQIRTGGADRVLLDGIRKKIEFAEKRKRMMEQGADKESTDSITKHQSDVLNANAAFNKAESTVDNLKAVMSGYPTTEVQINAQIEECKKKVGDFNKRSEEIAKRSWEWDDKNGFCPQCGQALPLGDVQLLKQESQNRFNSQKAEDMKELNNEFAKLQSAYTELNKELEKLNDDRQTTTNQLVKAHQALNDAEKHKAEVDADVPRTYEQILASKEEYQQVLKEISELQAELDKPSESNEDEYKLLQTLNEERKPLSDRYDEVLELLASKASYDNTMSHIEAAQNDKTTFQEQLDDIDAKLNTTNEFYQLSCKALEDKVNQHFRFVKWSLFLPKLDGEKKPYCECYHNGVPYSRLNGAAKVNAGIDIARTIGQFYDVSVPVVLDECESVNHPLSTGGQQIRLVVSKDDKLKVEYFALATMD